MSLKDPIARARYLKTWRRKRFQEAKLKPCACGCGGSVPEFGPSGRPRQYLPGHQRKRLDPTPPRVLRARRVACACGCGGTLLDRNKHGNKRRYLYGHSPTRLHEHTPHPTESAKPPTRKQQYTWNRRVSVLKHYGGDPPRCACCGEVELAFLAIDHEEGGGNEHRRQIRSRGGTGFYNWLLQRGLPKGYRVLCHNCNMAIGCYGQCPHQTRSGAEKMHGGSGWEQVAGFAGEEG